MSEDCAELRNFFFIHDYYLETDDICEKHLLLRTEKYRGEPFQYSIRMGLGAENAIRLYDDVGNKINIESVEKKIELCNQIDTKVVLEGDKITVNPISKLDIIVPDDTTIQTNQLKEVTMKCDIQTLEYILTAINKLDLIASGGNVNISAPAGEINITAPSGNITIPNLMINNIPFSTILNAISTLSNDLAILKATVDAL